MMLSAQRGQREVERLKREGGERQRSKEKKNEKVLNMDLTNKSVGQPSDVDINTQKLKCLLEVDNEVEVEGQEAEDFI